jgi:hypothetical protein
LREFAIEIGVEGRGRELLGMVTQWHQPPGRQYLTAEATKIEHPLLKGSERAFFIKMRPGSRVHRHRDPPGVVDWYDTDHVVVETNDKAFLCWADDEGEHRTHLGLGKRYRITDRGVMHWAENNGDTDRIHLLIEYPKV